MSLFSGVGSTWPFHPAPPPGSSRTLGVMVADSQPVEQPWVDGTISDLTDTSFPKLQHSWISSQIEAHPGLKACPTAGMEALLPGEGTG